VQDILSTAYNKGIRALDTAEAYGSSIDRIGSFHHSNPGCIFRVNSKCSEIASVNPGDLARTMQRQLDQLGIKSFDHYLLHKAAYMNNADLVEGLLEAKNAGMINSLGVSVYTNEELQAAIDVDYITSIQLPFNLLDNNNKRLSLLKRAVEKGKELHARSVFLQGLFFMEDGQVPQRLSGLRPYLQQLRNIARDFGISLNTLALQYVLQNKFISRVLIGAVNKSQLLDNLAAMKHSIPAEVFAEVEHIHVKETELLSPANW
jgi:uncharacterized protein